MHPTVLLGRSEAIKNVNPFTPPSKERLGKWIALVRLKMYLKCPLGFSPKESDTLCVNWKREATPMEVKGSNLRMLGPICRGPNPLARGVVLGKGGSCSHPSQKRSWKEGFVVLSLPVFISWCQKWRLTLLCTQWGLCHLLRMSAQHRPAGDHWFWERLSSQRSNASSSGNWLACVEFSSYNKWHQLNQSQKQKKQALQGVMKA